MKRRTLLKFAAIAGGSVVLLPEVAIPAVTKILTSPVSLIDEAQEALPLVERTLQHIIAETLNIKAYPYKLYGEVLSAGLQGPTENSVLAREVSQMEDQSVYVTIQIHDMFSIFTVPNSIHTAHYWDHDMTRSIWGDVFLDGQTSFRREVKYHNGRIKEIASSSRRFRTDNFEWFYDKGGVVRQYGHSRQGKIKYIKNPYFQILERHRNNIMTEFILDNIGRIARFNVFNYEDGKVTGHKERVNIEYTSTGFIERVEEPTKGKLIETLVTEYNKDGDKLVQNFFDEDQNMVRKNKWSRRGDGNITTLKTTKFSKSGPKLRRLTTLLYLSDIYAQLTDDVNGKTRYYACDLDKGMMKAKFVNMPN